MDENIQNSNVNNTQKPSGTAAIIMGIISLVCAFLSSTIIAAIIGFVLAIIATVSGNKCRNNGGSSAGFILGVLGIVFNCVGFVACVICFGGAALLA